MSVNIRDYVSDDHVESIGEIARSQSSIIQALSIDNSKQEKEIERLNNIINELEKNWKEEQEYYRYRKDNRYRTFLSKNLDKLKELKENKNE